MQAIKQGKQGAQIQQDKEVSTIWPFNNRHSTSK